MKITLEHYTERYLKDDLLDYAFKNNWFKLFVPISLGGRQVSLIEGVSQLINAAEIHGGLGWAVNLGAGAGFFCRNFTNSIAPYFFKDQKAVIAGSGKIGKAQSVEDGWIVSGKWDKASGYHHASLISANVKDESGNIFSVLLDKKQLTHLDDWSSFGLKSTSSWGFEAIGIFVPSENAFNIDQVKFEVDYPIYKMKFEHFAKFCMMASAIGIAKCFYNELNKTEANSEILIPFNNARIELEEAVRELAISHWNKLLHDIELSQDDDTVLNETAKTLGKRLFDLGNETFYLIGLRLSNENSVVYQAYLDLKLCTQHGMLK